MAKNFLKFCKMQDPTQPAFLFRKNHWSQYNIVINLKTSNYSIVISANYRVGNRDSPLSTPKDCFHFSNKKLGSTELDVLALVSWFRPKIGWAYVCIPSPSSDHTSLFPSFFSRQSQGSSLHMGYGRQGPFLIVLPVVKYHILDCHTYISIPVEGEQWKEEMEFISSVAGIADNQVQN